MKIKHTALFIIAVHLEVMKQDTAIHCSPVIEERHFICSDGRWASSPVQCRPSRWTWSWTPAREQSISREL